MNKIKYIKMEDEQGQISDNILIEVDAVNVDLEDGENVQNAINIINTDISSFTTQFNEMGNDIINLNNEINNCEKSINKVIEIDENSTDEQYPSAKAVYNLLAGVENALDNLIGEGE